MFGLRFGPAAERYFKKLKDAFRMAVVEIAENPGIGEAKIGELAAVHCHAFRHHQTKCEVAYRIYDEEAGQLAVIVLAGTRENFYEELKRYMK